MADSVVAGGFVSDQKVVIFTENVGFQCENSVKMVKEGFEANSYLDVEDNSCFSKCSSEDISGSPASPDFSSGYSEKDLEISSPGSEDDCRKKRCSDRYDSSESSDSGIAGSSGASTSSETSDITDPGSPFSTSSDDSSPAKSVPSPVEMPPNSTAPVAVQLPHFTPRPPQSVFPPKRPTRPADQPRVKRRIQRRASSDTQGKITEYFKSQMKPLVGIKRDFNYLKKELFCREPVAAKKPCETVACDTNIKQDVPKAASEFIVQPPSETQTLFNKILQNHKQRSNRYSENFHIVDWKEANKSHDEEIEKKAEKTEELNRIDDCGTPPPVEEAVVCDPILSQPKTIRFPVLEEKVKSVPSASGSSQYSCRWASCSRVCDAAGPLVDHLQNAHVVSQGCGESFVCLWIGCKVYNQKSCSRSWLERHVLIHAGNKPYRCIVEGCGQAFSTQSILQRHVNHHFAADVKKALDSSSGQKMIRRKGQKLRYRRQPWSARSFDFFDVGTLEKMEHRLVQATKARTDGCFTHIPSDSIVLTSEVIASRINPTGEKQFLLTWHPADLVDDEWVGKTDLKRRKVVPTRSMSHPAQATLSCTLGLTVPHRQGRKTRRNLPPPPSAPMPQPQPEPPQVAAEQPPMDIVPAIPTEEISASSDTKTAVENVVEEMAGPSTITSMELVPAVPIVKVKRKRKRSAAKLKSPIDPDSLPVAKVPLVDIVKSMPKPLLVMEEQLPSSSPSLPQHSFILNSQSFKLVSQQPSIMNLLSSPMPTMTYQLPQLPVQSPLFLLPPQQQTTSMFQTIHISSNIVQQQSILTSLNLKSPTLLLVNSTKQVSLSVSQERPKQKVQILPKPECLLPIRGPT